MSFDILITYPRHLNLLDHVIPLITIVTQHSVHSRGCPRQRLWFFFLYLKSICEQFFHKKSSIDFRVWRLFRKTTSIQSGDGYLIFVVVVLINGGGEMQDKLEKVRGKNDFFVAILALSRYGKTFIRVILNVRSFFKNKFYTDNVVFKTNRNAWKGFFFMLFFKLILRR